MPKRSPAELPGIQMLKWNANKVKCNWSNQELVGFFGIAICIPGHKSGSYSGKLNVSVFHSSPSTASVIQFLELEIFWIAWHVQKTDIDAKKSLEDDFPANYGNCWCPCQFSGVYISWCDQHIFRPWVSHGLLPMGAWPTTNKAISFHRRPAGLDINQAKAIVRCCLWIEEIRLNIG